MPATKASPKKSPKKALRGDLAPERIAAILKALDEAYPNAVCALNHKTPWELLVATILSAQTTDVRVNMVTPELFKRFPTPAAMAKAPIPEFEDLIRTTGFFRNKAKSIKGAATGHPREIQRRSPPHPRRTHHRSRRGAQDGQRRPRRVLWISRRRCGRHPRLPHRAPPQPRQGRHPAKSRRRVDESDSP